MSETPVLARVWREGKRVTELRVISVECDGEQIELLAPDTEVIFEEDEWDELTVQYK